MCQPADGGGGDFNCLLDPALDKNTNSHATTNADKARASLHALMNNLDISDPWRLRHPNRKTFTFRRGSYASRLDLLLLSNHLTESASDIVTTSLPYSDHNLISIEMGTTEFPPGPGLWRFNTDLLDSPDFPPKMLQFLLDWAPPPELSNPTVIWEWLKYEIASFIRDYTRRRRCI